MSDNELVWLHAMKWPGTAHYDYQLFPLGDDEFGRWLGHPGPLPIFRGDSFLFEWSYRFLVLIPPGEAEWKAEFYVDHPKMDVYVDVIYGLESGIREIKYFDVDLDVVRWNNGTVEILDIDEFAENQAALRYPQEMTDAAMPAARRIKEMIERGEDPWGSASQRWFAALP